MSHCVSNCRGFVRAVLVLLAATMLLPAGCVRRRLNVRSNPPGAMVFVDNQQIGTTPCSVDFIYYGTREIRLVKPGYETLTINQPIPTPWYQIPPLDFVSENLVPTNILDHRTVCFDMQPQVIVPTEQLLDRAEQLRQETVQGAELPASGTIAPGAMLPAVPPPVPLPPTGAAPPPAVVSETTVPPPFTGPALPPPAPFVPQQGPPIVSPPLR